jgi:hypothetical protein
MIAYPQVATWLPEKLNAEFRALKVEQVEDNVPLDAYQQDGGYGEALSDAIKDAREEEAQENKGEGGAGDSLKKDEATKAGK